MRVGLDSRGLAISDDGRYVIVGNYIPATAVILDAATLEPLTVIRTEAADPEGNRVASRVAITSDVSEALVGPYFLIALKEAGQVWRIDYSQPDFPIRVVQDVGHILHDAFLSPDNTRFCIASQRDNWMAVIDVGDDDGGGTDRDRRHAASRLRRGVGGGWRGLWRDRPRRRGQGHGLGPVG
ncbi:MAG: hypothetical protein M5R40_27135 [Anaerolineae bacterium]|nr:hypothetical protein [Anaerolineae bacterium]